MAFKKIQNFRCPIKELQLFLMADKEFSLAMWNSSDKRDMKKADMSTL
jgi:hypothetical protein